MELKSWEDVLEAQKNGEDAYFIPNIKEHEGSMFELREIKMIDIPYEHFTTLWEYEEDDCIDDAEIVYDLIRAYQNSNNVPPIILDSNFKIIDGFHRTSALDYIGLNKLKAYVKIS